jgi:hypothetical protein
MHRNHSSKMLEQDGSADSTNCSKNTIGAYDGHPPLQPTTAYSPHAQPHTGNKLIPQIVAALDSCLARGAPIGVTATPPACEPSPPFWDSAPSVAKHWLQHREGSALGEHALIKVQYTVTDISRGEVADREHKHTVCSFHFKIYNGTCQRMLCVVAFLITEIAPTTHIQIQ